MSKPAAASRRKPSWLEGLRDFLYGLTGFELAQHALEMRSSLESLFMLATLGDILGLPIIPPYFNLRILPYVVPSLSAWKRRMLRQREFSDEHDYDLHGL